MFFFRPALVLAIGLLVFASAGCGGDTAKQSDPAPDGDGSVSARAVIQSTRSVGGVPIEEEFETIRLFEVMMPVAKKLKLKERWTMASAHEAEQHLGKNVQLAPIRGTDLIEIRYIGTDAAFAIAVVDGITDSYVDYRAEVAKARVTTELKDLEKEVRPHERALKDSRSLLLHFINPEAVGGRGARKEKPTDKEIALLRSIVKSLEGKHGQDLIGAVHEAAISDFFIDAHYPRFEAAKIEALDLKASGLGDSHPKRLAAERRLDSCEEVLLSNVERIQSRAQRELMIFEARYGSGKARDAFAEQAENDYEDKKTKLEEVKKKLAMKRTELKSPRNPVQIHQPAELE